MPLCLMQWQIMTLHLLENAVKYMANILTQTLASVFYMEPFIEE
jgi:hypothetical protein